MVREAPFRVGMVKLDPKTKASDSDNHHSSSSRGASDQLCVMWFDLTGKLIGKPYQPAQRPA